MSETSEEKKKEMEENIVNISTIFKIFRYPISLHPPYACYSILDYAWDQMNLKDKYIYCSNCKMECSLGPKIQKQYREEYKSIREKI